MQRLSMSSSVYSCQLQSVSESCANAKAGPSNNSNFETLLDRKFSSFNTQLQQLNQDINDLNQLRSSSAGTSFSSTKPRNNKIFSCPNNFAPMRSRTFSFPRYSSNFQQDSANRNGAGAKWAAPVMTKSCSPLPHIKNKESGLLFLLDSGAKISLVKPLPHEHRNQQASNPLVTVDGAPIATFGFRTMYISFHKVTTFRWIFVIADVSNNIIGADFLKHFASMKLVRAGCNSRWELQTKSIALISAPKTFLPSDKYLKLLASFPDLTTPPNKHKPVKHSVVHHIVTKGYLSSSRPRQFSPEKLEFVKKEIDYLLERGIISRSESPVSSALHLVPKGQPGNFRLLGDYRKLNQQTVPDRYPTPSVTHLLHRLQGSCIFSKVDLVRAYHQIPVANESRHKTAITTPIGLFEYNFLPFGLRNASSTFQRFIDQVCHGLPYVLP